MPNNRISSAATQTRTFVGYVRSMRRIGCADLLTRHNLRALWIQSAAGWRPEAIDLTDEERDAFMEACGGDAA